MNSEDLPHKDIQRLRELEDSLCKRSSLKLVRTLPVRGGPAEAVPRSHHVVCPRRLHFANRRSGTPARQAK